jgi:hypothetical protein
MEKMFRVLLNVYYAAHADERPYDDTEQRESMPMDCCCWEGNDVPWQQASNDDRAEKYSHAAARPTLIPAKSYVRLLYAQALAGEVPDEGPAEAGGVPDDGLGVA